MPRGFILGGFRLPTLGHQHLLDFASGFCGGDLDVMLCTRDEDEIPGEWRLKWLGDHFGDRARIRRFHNDLPEDPTTTPDFWGIWNRAILATLDGQAPDFLFASEPYGKRLADDLKARFIPVDPARDSVAISASRLRVGLAEHWRMLLPSARPYFLKRIAIIGAESTGKTTLARKLAASFHTLHVAEWARTYLENTDPSHYPGEGELAVIAAGQAAAEDALARQANRVLFLDTDHLCTAVWGKVALGRIPPAAEREIARRPYDLRLLLADDVPLVPDILRYGGDRRQLSCEHFVDELTARQLPYTLISGSWAERHAKAITEVERIMAEPHSFQARR